MRLPNLALSTTQFSQLAKMVNVTALIHGSAVASECYSFT